MPFKSKAQAGYMFANKPKVAKEFAEETPDITELPVKAPKAPKPLGTKKTPKMPKAKKLK